jgi:EAL domain-containing protein (putative c-di-GMP-specific phosphodiesterase class I)
MRDVASESDDAAIVQAIIAMSHHLKLSVTAEGVETPEQEMFLRGCKCDFAQGWHFGRPVSAEATGLLLAAQSGV